MDKLSFVLIIAIVAGALILSAGVCLPLFTAFHPVICQAIGEYYEDYPLLTNCTFSDHAILRESGMVVPGSYHQGGYLSETIHYLYLNSSYYLELQSEKPYHFSASAYALISIGGSLLLFGIFMTCYCGIRKIAYKLNTQS